jgi:hypothetical protein
MNHPSLPTSPTGFQYIPVPNEHFAAIVTYLGTLVGGQSPETVAEATTPEIIDTDLLVVDDDDLRRFIARTNMKVVGTICAMLDKLAESPGKDNAMSTREIAKETGLDYSVITQKNRSIDKRFPALRGAFQAAWGSTQFVPPRTPELYYWITPEFAIQWKRVRS